MSSTPGSTLGSTLGSTAASAGVGDRPTLAPTRAELAGLLQPARGVCPVVLVPTMGALHEGHASLLRLARSRAGADGVVVASVFVNPLQFGAGEDLDRYPRTLAADLETCAEEGVDVVFAPAVDEVYPGGDPMVGVAPGPLGEVLEGRTRPGHFAGVLTVVAKLLGLVRPDAAVFGEKDYQQLVLVRRMVEDLCLGVEVVGAPTVREADGLALSSRNRFLSDEQRRQAPALHRALRAAADAAPRGADAALALSRAELREAHGVDLDYLVLTDADLAELPGTRAGAVPPAAAPRATTVPGRALIAARLGETRLIDNLPLAVGVPDGALEGTGALRGDPAPHR